MINFPSSPTAGVTTVTVGRKSWKCTGLDSTGKGIWDLMSTPDSFADEVVAGVQELRAITSPTPPSLATSAAGREWIDPETLKRYTVMVDDNGTHLVEAAGFYYVDDAVASQQTLEYAEAAAASEAAAVAAVGSAQFANYTALRAYAGTSKTAYVTGYLVTAAPSGVAGLFTLDSLDVSSSDNDGTLIVATNGKRWKRVFSGPVKPEWFNCTGDGVVDDSVGMVKMFASGFSIELTAGKTYKVNNSLTAPVGITISGSGILLFTAGALTIGTGTTVQEIGIRGNSRANANHGINILANATDVVVQNCNIKQVGMNGVKVTGGTGARIRILDNIFEDCGGGTFNVTFQGMGVYVDAGVSDVSVNGNSISRISGNAGVFLNGVVGAQVNNNKIFDTYFRGIQVNGAGSAKIVVAQNQINRCGAINASSSGVGCNGIFVSGPTTPEQVLVIANQIGQVAENGIEGMCTALGNVVMDTGFYPALVTPSKEGIFVNGSGGICIANTIVNAGLYGISVYKTASCSKMKVADNVIINPLSAGIRVMVDGAGVSMTDSEITGNTVHGGNDAAQLGFWMLTANSATFGANILLADNKVFGRATNTIGGTFIQYHNSWNNEHKLTMTEGSRRSVSTAMNNASGGFRRWMQSYGIDFDGTNFQVDNIASVKTYVTHDNNKLSIGAVPAATVGALTSNQFAGYDRLRVDDTSIWMNIPTSATGLTSGKVWSNAGVLTIVP